MIQTTTHVYTAFEHTEGTSTHTHQCSHSPRHTHQSLHAQLNIPQRTGTLYGYMHTGKLTLLRVQQSATRRQTTRLQARWETHTLKSVAVSYTQANYTHKGTQGNTHN